MQRQGAIWLGLITFALAACLGAAQAQNYPTRPIKVIVPYPAGGVLDSLTRAIGDRVRPILGQPWVVENRPGGNGSIGLQACAASEPDGYTLCAATVEALTVTPHYDPEIYERYKTLTAVSEFARGTGVVYAHPDVAARDLKELVELARQKPGELQYASFGPGSSPQLVFEWLNKTQNTNIQHVPYKGSQDALTDVLAGRVPVSYVAIGLVLPHIRAGKLKPLAILGHERTPLLSDVPSMAELGFKFPDMNVWFGLMAPSGTPPQLRDTVANAVRAAVNDPELRSKFLDPQAFRPVGSSPKDFADTIRSDSAQGAELIRQSGVRAK